MSMVPCARCDRPIDIDANLGRTNDGVYCFWCVDDLEAELTPDPDELERELAGMGGRDD